VELIHADRARGSTSTPLDPRNARRDPSGTPGDGETPTERLFREAFSESALIPGNRAARLVGVDDKTSVKLREPE
jgi:hypothetical protein